VKEEGYAQVNFLLHFRMVYLAQSKILYKDLSLGLFRSDYMLHAAGYHENRGAPVELKQVEFNTCSCAGGSHSNKISDMHRYLNLRY
jgi:hypothetical protein